MFINAALNLEHFSCQKDITVFQLDGKQQTTISTFMVTRFSLLDNQFAKVGYRSVFEIAASCVALFKVFVPLFNIVVVKLTKNTILKNLGSGITVCTSLMNKVVDKILNQAGLLINTACLISYIVMIALGNVLVGAFGIAGLVLIVIKEKGYLPGRLERGLVPFELINSLIVSWTTPRMLFFKAIAIGGALYGIFNYLEKNSAFDFLSSKFIATEGYVDAPMVRFPENWEEIIQGGDFRIDFRAMHSKNLNEAFSSEDKAELDGIDIRELYDSVEGRVRALGIPINLEGWQLIKDAVISDFLRDARPINFDHGREILKMVLYKMSRSDDEKFEADVKELSEIGGACVTGWFREIGYMLDQKSKTDIAWVVHHRLAEMREDFIKEGIRKFNEKIHAHHPGLSLDAVGGENNVHLFLETATVLAHRWPTRAAQMNFSMNGKSILMKFLQTPDSSDINKKFEMNIRNAINSFRNVNVPLNVSIPHFVGRIDRFLKSSYTIDAICESFYCEWDPIASWLASLESKGIEVLEQDEEGQDQYKSLLVGTNPDSSPCLTKEGVLLLLWDLGIIQPI